MNSVQLKLAMSQFEFNLVFALASALWTFVLNELMKTYPALRTAPVQLNEAAAVPVAFALYGDAMTLSPSSSSDTAVVRLMRSSSDIYENK